MVEPTASAGELAAAIRAKEIGSVELLDAYLHRIDRLNGAVNAVVTLDADRARAAARAADDALVRGDEVGPLHGLPITIKDAIEVAGVRSTGGAVALRDHVPAVDAPVVQRLKAAGAVVFGKTNVPEWSGDLQTYNEIFGTTNNPWDTTRAPGGSSGGPAAAVASGFTAFEIGTDIGGSIRNPSHFCGIWGLKPSYGVVSQRGYLDYVGGGTTDADINVFGPMARSAEDLALLIDIVGGPNDDDALAWRLGLPEPDVHSLDRLRVAVWFDEPGHPIDAEYRAVLDAAVGALEARGARVEAAHPVEFDEQVALFNQLISAAVSRSLAPEIAEAAAGPHLAWLEADRRRAALRRHWATWFEDFDVLLCPVAPSAAFTHRQDGDLFSRTLDVNGGTVPYFDVVAWAGLIGVVGLPVAVPPLGLTASGLPVGVQVIAPYLRDHRAVRVAALLAAATDGAGYHVPPGFA